jgi:hypothetical protein
MSCHVHSLMELVVRLLQEPVTVAHQNVDSRDSLACSALFTASKDC